MTRKLFSAVASLWAVAAIAALGFQTRTASVTVVAEDPGARGGSAGAGDALAGLSPSQSEYFALAKGEFSEQETVADGLGPRMNLDSCSGCHLHPAIGGSSPAVNPQVAFATQDGGIDAVPPFLALNGPVREARFVRNADGTGDGGVHALFTITGRTGAKNCRLTQPDFVTELANRNVIFRIPTPTFGAGLIEQIPDATIVANQLTNATAKSGLGIRGRPNFSVAGRAITGQTNDNGNDGTIARFGWKAQNKSLLLFSAEAYNVEMGITNELFQTERDETSACQTTTIPNSITNTDATTTAAALSSIEKFALFTRFLAPPTPSGDTPGGANSVGRGRAMFNTIGCALCHTPTMTTGNSAVAALRNQSANLFSDLLIHDMGVGLADGVSQGQAGGREFRTAPLWGLGQRIFFLHDGRTSNLITSILTHSSVGSEANGVVANYAALSEGQKQDLLDFLRSL